MSVVSDWSLDEVDKQNAEIFGEFLDAHYTEELQRMASGVEESRTLYVDTADLEQYFPPEDYQTIVSNIEKHNEMLSYGVVYADSTQGHLSEVNARIVDRVGADVAHVGVSELNSEHVSEYVGVTGQLTAVTKIRSFPSEAVWVCTGCGVTRKVAASTRELPEPTTDCNCERRPDWSFNYSESTFVDHRLLKIQQPPENASNGETQHVVAHMIGADTSDQHGTPLIERTGEDVTVYGVVEVKQEDGRGAAEYLFNHYLRGKAVTFEDGGLEAVNIEEHRDEVEEHAAAEDVYERFYTSLAPQIQPTPQMELAMKVCAAYLFAAPRIDPDNGPMYRGDIHAAIIGDPGMAKSVLLAGVSEFSPDAEHRSATGLSSDVGLVAAAVDDEFGDGGWTLKPGILVRAGMHAIIDEIDKGPDELEKINDALEGRQIATVDKGGIKADLKTRTGLLTSGNPKNSRFTKHEPLPTQVDIDESLLTRFDAIILLQDRPDEEQDRKIASHITDSYMEGVELMREDGIDEPQSTKRDVSPEVGRAWVALGRQIIPRMSDEASERLEEYYVDARSLNSDMDEGDNAETFSATARQLEGGLRFAMAFARMRLSETVEPKDVDMAIDVSKALIGQTHDPDEGSFNIDYLTTSDAGDDSTSEYESIRGELSDALDTMDWKYADEIAREVSVPESKVRNALQKAKSGELSLPVEEERGKWRLN